MKPKTLTKYSNYLTIKLNNILKSNIVYIHVYTKKTSEISAFATSAEIILTTALIKILTKREMEAVMLHEASHVINKDQYIYKLTKKLIDIICICLSVILNIFIYLKPFNSYETAFMFMSLSILCIMIVIVSPYIINIFLKRKNEYKADSLAKKYGYKNEMVSSLKKISNGRKSKFYESHPPTNLRIKKIEKGL